MTEGLIRGEIHQEWRLVRISDVIVRERQRQIDDNHVEAVRKSYRELGGQLQLQPIVLDGDLVLIDGGHRLEAAKREGWEFISSLICAGVTDEDRPLLEAEANRVRKQLSPVELEDAWRTYYEPAFRARAKQNQQLGPKGFQDDHESYLPGNTGKVASDERVLMPKAAKEVTGMGLDWLNKVSDIRSLAGSQTAPEPLREAAQRGLDKLKRPGSKVEPIHKELLRLQEAYSARSLTSEERRARELERTLDRVVRETTLLSEKLEQSLADELSEAARVAPGGSEMLRATRVAITHSLAAVVTAECSIEHDKTVALERIGREVTRLLSELSIARLGLEVDR